MKKECINCEDMAKGSSISKGIGGLCLSTKIEKTKINDNDSCEFWREKDKD